jgi:hypothetical protein
MEIRQKDDGSAQIVFTDEEIKIINEKKCFEFTDIALRHFGNHLMNMVVNWNRRFKPSVRGEPTIPKAKTEK